MLPPPATNIARDPPTLTIHLLGTFRVWVGGRAVPPEAWRLRKAGHLVKLLALSPGHTLHREQVCEVLWPEADPDAAYQRLRYALHVARDILADPVSPAQILLPLRHNMLALCPTGTLSIDAEAFSAAAERCGTDLTACRTALDLYGGVLLPEDRYEAWAEERRAGLHAMHQMLILTCAALHEAQDDYAEALALMRRLVADDPLHEEAHVGMMRLLARLGQRTQALAQYAHLRTVLARELDVAPAPASQQLYAAILARQFPLSSQPPASSASASHLPLSLTRLIGREREQAEVEGVLATHRLVTLTGAGGCGKTRLALAIAAASTATYADGAWLVECAPLADPARVPGAVAAALNIRERASMDVTETMIAALRHRHLLLVIDNCEHVVQACGTVIAALLAACPHLHVLATSRQALRVPGEVVWRVPSLSLPPVVSVALDDLEASEAVQLFVDRVRWHIPDFTLTEANAAHITAICRRLDGMPLALELAAARTNVLTVAQLVPRLDDALGVLTEGARTVALRQQTLRATLDWSYALLDAHERRLFARLSLFVGGCDLAAAEEVCGGRDLAREAILGILAHLVEKSLVGVELQRHQARYRLLEVVRQYARERLADDPEYGQTERRHAEYYVALAERTDPNGQGALFARLEIEHDNVRAALAYAVQTQSATLGLHLGASLWRFWYACGHLSEGHIWLTRLLALGRTAPELLSTGVWLEALFGAGRVAYFRDDHEAALTYSHELLAAAQAQGDKAHVANALTQLGNIAHYRGDFATAQNYFAAGLALRREVEDQRGIGSSLGNMGWVALLQGDFAAARSHFTECLPLNRQQGDSVEIIRTLTGLGLVATGLRKDAQAHAHLAEALTLAQQIGAKRAIADCLDSLAALAVAQGYYVRALRLAGAADALEAAIEHPLPSLWRDRRAEALAPARVALGDAATDQHLMAGRALPLEAIIAEALNG